MRSCILITALSTLTLLGCTEKAKPDSGPGTEEVVMTTFYPTTWMAQQLLQGQIPVRCPLPAGEDPVFWNPSREAIQEYQRARLIVTNGAALEKWTQSTSLPSSRIVETAKPLESEFIHFKTITHSHGPKGAHTHQGTDGHTWMDPVNAQLQARRLCDALIETWPDKAESLRRNLEALDKKLEALHSRLKTLTPRIAKVTLLCSHPAYNYLARRLGWTVHNFGLEPGEDLVAKDLETLKAARVPGRPTLLLWEAEPTAKSRKALDDLGITSVVFSPAESPSPDEAARGFDVLMGENIDRLQQALKP